LCFFSLSRYFRLAGLYMTTASLLLLLGCSKAKEGLE
jgi:hypothetical protein